MHTHIKEKSLAAIEEGHANLGVPCTNQVLGTMLANLPRGQVYSAPQAGVYHALGYLSPIWTSHNNKTWTVV